MEHRVRAEMLGGKELVMVKLDLPTDADKMFINLLDAKTSVLAKAVDKGEVVIVTKETLRDGEWSVDERQLLGGD